MIQGRKSFNLPHTETENMLEKYQSLLEDVESTRVVVVGEAKRGKSSFINALISEDILPVYEEVATSKVFLVRQNRNLREARLRFEDGTTSKLDFDMISLARIGSQALYNAGDNVQLSKKLRWIEVDIPNAFLVSDVDVIDTPGLGSIYPEHSAITRREISGADAVIFVIDSSAPLNELEVSYVSEILRHTSNIFFVMTKIDIPSVEQWEKIKEQSEAILRETFSDRILNPVINPVSSLWFQQFWIEGGTDEFLYDRSRFGSMKQSLESFILQNHRWVNVSSAVIDCFAYATEMEACLAERLMSLQSPIGNTNDIKKAEAQKVQFMLDWSSSGKKRDDVKRRLRAVATRGKTRMRDVLRRDLSLEFVKLIEAASSGEELQQIGNTLLEAVKNRALEQYDIFVYDAQNDSSLIVGEVTHQTQRLIVPVNRPQLAITTIPSNKEIDSVWNYVKRSRAGALTAGFFANISLKAMFAFRENRTEEQKKDDEKKAFWVSVVASALGALVEIASTQKAELKSTKDGLIRSLHNVIATIEQDFEKKDKGMGIIENTFEGLYDAYWAEVENTLQKREQDLTSRITELKKDSAQKTSHFNSTKTIREQHFREWKNITKKLTDMLVSLGRVQTTLEKM